jgi:hypothetical protein
MRTLAADVGGRCSQALLDFLFHAQAPLLDVRISGLRGNRSDVDGKSDRTRDGGIEGVLRKEGGAGSSEPPKTSNALITRWIKFCLAQRQRRAANQ